MASEERLQILDMIAQGKITAQQGIELLNALEDEVDPAGNFPAGTLPEETLPEEDLPADEPEAVDARPAPEPETRQAETIPAQPIPDEVTPAEPIPDEVIPAEPTPTEVTPVSPIPAAPIHPVVDEDIRVDDQSPAPEAPPQASQTAYSQASPTIVEELPETPSFDPRAEKWRGWWRIPLWIGVIATILTGLLLYSIYNAAGFNFWFACAWFPFLLSVGIVALAWASRSAHWIHIRVHQRPGERPQNIAISFPIPLGLMAWFLRTFRSKIPNIQGVNPDEMILALNHVSPEQPFYVEVNENDGERVEVYIG